MFLFNNQYSRTYYRFSATYTLASLHQIFSSFLSSQLASSIWSTKAAFLVRVSETIAFLTGHSVACYVRSLAPLTPLTRYAALYLTTLASLACTLFTVSLTHFAHSLVGWLKFMNMSSCCYRVSFVVVTRNAPLYRFGLR